MVYSEIRVKKEEIRTVGNADNALSAFLNIGRGFTGTAGDSLYSGAGRARPYLLFLIS
jgi:hypothetical protein